jgi:hypothetical protein
MIFERFSKVFRQIEEFRIMLNYQLYFLSRFISICSEVLFLRRPNIVHLLFAIVITRENLLDYPEETCSVK